MDEDNVHSSQFFVLSVDTLCRSKIDQTIGNGWVDRPPLFEGKPERQKRKLDESVRTGIPPALRCAIWISSIIRLENPQQDPAISDEYATLGKARALEHGWNIVLNTAFPNESDEVEAIIPTFGLSQEKLDIILNGKNNRDWSQLAVETEGRKALARVLCSVHFMLGVEYAPLLPDITALLLSYMPESYAYVTLREMISDGHHFLATTIIEHYQLCRTFSDVLRKMFPETWKKMNAIGALTPEGLSPIFERFFVPLFKREHIFRIMDLYTIEGFHLIFRIGIVLIGMVKKPLKSMNITNSEQWWEEVKDITHAPTFDFGSLVKRAFGSIGGKYRKSRRFPKRLAVARLVKINETWAEENAPTLQVTVPVRPLGLVKGDIECTLAKPAAVRLNLSNWLPASLRGTKLDMIYSSNVHGRSLERFYEHVSKTKRTFMLLEVIQTQAVIGMFATSAWHRNPRVYGDGSCFLFRASPDPQCYKWKPTKQSISGEEEDDFENIAVLEQFMVSTHHSLSMGANHDGTCGLRLNEDLSLGLSAPAVGFDNEPLAGQGVRDFDIGLVEVYQLVREVDGVPLDRVDEIWKF